MIGFYQSLHWGDPNEGNMRRALRGTSETAPQANEDWQRSTHQNICQANPRMGYKRV